MKTILLEGILVDKSFPATFARWKALSRSGWVVHVYVSRPRGKRAMMVAYKPSS